MRLGPPRLLLIAGLRHLARRPLQALLPVFGVALGVALVLAVDLANQAALDSMRRSVEAVAGRASHRILGGADELPEELLGRILREQPEVQATPVLERDVLLADAAGQVLRVLGIDPLSAAAFGGAAAALPVGGVSAAPDAERSQAPWTELLARGDGCLLAPETAERLEKRAGDTIALLIGTERVDLKLIGTLDPALLGLSASNLLLMDVAAAQERFMALGRLSRIELILPPGEPGRRASAAIEALLPNDARLEPAGARSGQLARLTRAFRQNLQALAGLSLFVGAFLITNAVRLSVVERRALWRRLVALGATRAQLLAGLLGETLVLAALGSGLGLLLGFGLSNVLGVQVRRTIQELYTPLVGSGAGSFASAAPLAFVLGLLTALLAALPPALEATREASREAAARSALEDRAGSASRRGLWLALMGIALSAGLFAIGSRRLETSYLALIALLLGLAAGIPWLAGRLLELITRPLGRTLGALGRLSADAAVRSLSRTALAIAALSIALAATLSVSILIASFRSSLESWLEGTLVADIYAAPPALAAVRGARGNFEADLARRLAGAPGVVGAQYVRQAFTPSSVGELELMAIDFGQGQKPRYFFTAGDPEQAWPRFLAGQAVFISEPLAFHRRLGVGDSLELETPSGPLRLPIAAVIRDYGSERGLCWIAREAYVTAYRDGALSSMALWVAPGLDPEAVLGTLRGELRAGQELFLRSNRGLKRESLAIFDRTFEVTELLRLLTLSVALIGTLAALLALALERTREIALWRALGLSPGQLATHLTLFGGLLGLLAGLFAAPIGALLAVLMMGIVNRDSFGWTLLEWRFPPTEFALAIGLATLFAALAALASMPVLTRRELARDLAQE